jgi:uncharacterized cupin superfamily protein
VAVVGLAHWDDVEWHRLAKGEMDAEWQLLGQAAETVGVGVNRVRVAPGRLPTPPHSHGAAEELYYVLAGAGLAWQDEAVHHVRPGDCVIHRPDHFEHTFIAGPEGLEFLVFGTRHPTELGWLPRSRAIRLGWPWVEGRTDDPWEIEAQSPPLEAGEPAPRPDNIVNIDEVEHRQWPSGPAAPLATRERSTLSGLHWGRLEEGLMGAPPHCHSEEEEVFVVLEGNATLELWPSPEGVREGEAVEHVPLRAGHVVSRPPGSRVSHAFRGGAGGVTMLTYGTRKPNDMCWYPRSNKLSWRGLGVIGRIETLDYWDGEPVE